MGAILPHLILKKVLWYFFLTATLWGPDLCWKHFLGKFGDVGGGTSRIR